MISCVSVQTVGECISLRHRQARAHTHAHKQPSLLSDPVAMEPVAKAERYGALVMEVVDEGDGHDHGDDQKGENEEGKSCPRRECKVTG